MTRQALSRPQAAPAAGQNLNDNLITGNYIAGNGADTEDAVTPGPTGINVFGVTPIIGTVISHNVITRNAYDCGVTAPGHNPLALDSSGQPQPAKAGVFSNLIEHNQITFNGLKG